jgi:predicted nucleic acid binding AN1-type Zn finger protein
MDDDDDDAQGLSPTSPWRKNRKRKDYSDDEEEEDKQDFENFTDTEHEKTLKQDPISIDSVRVVPPSSSKKQTTRIFSRKAHRHDLALKILVLI